MSIRDFKTINKRLQFIEENKKIKLENIKIYPPDLEKAQFTNCENMIGAIQIPLGVAGPLLINGQYVKGDYYLPLATTEGAFVASVSRGCKAITQSGGVTVAVEDVGATRGPVFKTSGIKESQKFQKWLDDNFHELRTIASKTSGHLKLKKKGVFFVGGYVYVRFYFDTKEAMGMNMATIATSAIVGFIEANTAIKCISVAGNFDIDKKPSWLNFISGRGKKVWAEATISGHVIRETLKTNAQTIHNIWLSKCMLGSIMSGSLGFNAHFANVIAALFLATGQDIAHVTEGSVGITTTEVKDDNLYVSVYLPDLMVGTIGGGTGLPSQKDALSILNIYGEKDSSLKLAEICGSAILAGEISLLASLAEGSLASAHERLARQK
ncbi:hydroxymethylglutaryl-CoA reductase [Candidatus Gottesmanbacteria bacterium]|nr:hydroxymethylglutaryl-CoA reductase [Candidatus Gottesmanbacteria bacterium]